MDEKLAIMLTFLAYSLCITCYALWAFFFLLLLLVEAVVIVIIVVIVVVVVVVCVFVLRVLQYSIGNVNVFISDFFSNFSILL